MVAQRNKVYRFRHVQRDAVPISSVLEANQRGFIEYQDKYEIRQITKDCQSKKGIWVKAKVYNKKTGKGGSQGYRVYSIDGCGVTVCSSSGGIGAYTGLYDVDGGIRTLSINETLRMFGFDLSYKYESLDNKKYMIRLLGNSIVVNVLEQIILDL